MSRSSVISTEWSLSQTDFHLITLRVGFVPEVDLFATDLNHKTTQYLSPCPDPAAVAIDSFNVDWSQWENLYLFPPTALISKALAKLRETKFVKAILVCQQLEGRAWFHNLHLFNKSSFQISLNLQVVNNRLIIQDHPTKLVVWTLYNSTSDQDSHKLPEHLN